jgi:integrase
MARPATGQVLIDSRGQTSSFALRFRAYRQRHYLTLGSASDGWTHAKAELELQNVLADVRRGIWRPAAPAQVTQAPTDPRFHEFASQWFEANKDEWRPKTRLDYHWQLTRHLLPFFKDHHLSQITIAEVDRYRQAKVAEARAAAADAAKGRLRSEEYVDKNGCTRRRPARGLSPTSINKTITRLGQILEVAVEYGLIQSNPAKGRRRRLRAPAPTPVWLDSAEQVEVLLAAAAELDRAALATGGREHHGGTAYRRPLLATLVFGGLRISELTALQWRDVDLAGSRLWVRASKTDAGVRAVDLLPVLHDELAEHKARTVDPSADAFVFASAAGTELKQSNIRRRVLERSVELANRQPGKTERAPLPEQLTPHKLRHTFASILVAIGVDPGSVMDQLGHTDPGFTLRVYRHGMRREPAARQRLRELVGGASTTSGAGAPTTSQNTAESSPAAEHASVTDSFSACVQR